MATTDIRTPPTPTGSRRRLVAGAIVWISVVQYFVMLLVVQAAWTTPYSVVMNAISDLGAVGCGEFEGRDVCSPWHPAANASWVLAGLAVSLGVVLMHRFLPAGWRSRVGGALLFVAGLALVSVGLNPEDASALHIPSAVTAILIGLPAIILLGSALVGRRGWGAAAWAGIALGTIGLLSVVVLLFAPAHLFGLFERFAAYPILVWTIVAGVNALTRALRRDDETRDV
jgi:hypothetical membrane protein